MWSLPNKEIFDQSNDYDESDQMEEAWKEAYQITEKMDELGSRLEIENITIAPQVVKFRAIAAEGVQVRLLKRYQEELQYELGCESVRILTPVPGEKYVGIEISNPRRRIVRTGDIIDYAISPLTFPAGISPDNEIVNINLRTAPHMLVAGTTGSGKSNFLNSMICSLLSATTPAELMLMMIDTKQVELPIYNGIPHMPYDCITDAYEAVKYLKALVHCMEQRYLRVKGSASRSLEEHNAKLSESQQEPYIVLVVDEAADLVMLSKHDVEESVVRIAQKARAVGIHLVLATQSPRREIITGLLKANLPTRVGFSTSSGLDSRIILDKMGAENLLGEGDCLYSDQGRAPIRLQSPFISTEEIESVVSHWRDQVINEVLV